TRVRPRSSRLSFIEAPFAGSPLLPGAGYGSPAAATAVPATKRRREARTAATDPTSVFIPDCIATSFGVLRVSGEEARPTRPRTAPSPTPLRGNRATRAGSAEPYRGAVSPASVGSSGRRRHTIRRRRIEISDQRPVTAAVRSL